MDESFGLIVEQVESLESSTLLGGKVKVIVAIVLVLAQALLAQLVCMLAFFAD